MIPSFKVSGFVVGLAYLELGRIHEGWGLLEDAREFYLRFLRTDPIDDYADWPSRRGRLWHDWMRNWLRETPRVRRARPSCG